MEKQKSFEDAAFELFKTLCPGKNFKRDEIPYQTVREMLDKHLNSMDSEKRQRLLARIKGETGQGPSGSDNKVENRMGSPSKPKTLSEGRSYLLADRHHLLPKLEDFNEAQKIHLKYPKNVRKFVRMRTERRLAAESNDYVSIVCDEKKLPEVFGPIYDQILRKRKTSVQCYHMIINTLHHYFMRKTWSDLVPGIMDDFIRKHVILTCNQLTIKYDREDRQVDIFERLREYELMVLLELHLIKKHPEKIEQTQVVNKLGFLVFVSEAGHMQRFLDEVVCDQFAHIMPKALVYVFDELCINLPPDLEDPSSEPGPSRLLRPEIRESERRSSRKSGGSAALIKLIWGDHSKKKENEKERKHGKSKSEESSPEPERGKPKMDLRAKAKKAERISKRIAAREKEEKKEQEEEKNEEEEESPSSDTDSEGEDLGEIIVPSTPKSKMKKKPVEKISRPGDVDVVMQTPIDKLNRIPTRKNMELAALLEKNIKMDQARKRMSTSAAALQTKMQVKRPARSSLPSSPSTSVLANISRTRSARVNLNKRFEMMDRLKQGASSPAATAASSPTTPQNVVTDIALDKGIIERYRKRLETVRHSARKCDKNEIFYGRCTSRRNLFDDSSAEEDNEGVATRSTACMQKNRSGRSVQTSQKVYMAHALLNVYNTDPLNPPKLPKDAPFKLHRLIRPASKSDKKRLFKFRLRLAREKSGSSSALVKYGTPSEGSEATSSSLGPKAKSESPEGKLPTGSEKRETLHAKDGPENGNSSSASSRKSGDLFKEPRPRKPSRKSSAPSNLEAVSPFSNGTPKKNTSRSARKLSDSSNGFSPNKSKSSDSNDTNGTSSSENSAKSSNGTIDGLDVPADPSGSPGPASELSGSTSFPKKKLRKTSVENGHDKAEVKDEKSEKLAEMSGKEEEKQEEMDVS